MITKKRPERYTSESLEWIASFGFCWRCRRRGLPGQSLFVHHFVQGAHRVKNDLKTTAIVCQGCHDKEHSNGDGIGLLGWLALKRRYDPTRYDLAHVCKLRGRAETAITEPEVTQAARKLT